MSSGRATRIVPDQDGVIRRARRGTIAASSLAMSVIADEDHPNRAAADAAGLRWVSDGGPGIRRLGKHPRFRYVDAKGRPVRAPATLARIRGLVIPPAWTSVWICPTSNGHIQATGRDVRRRKQYRYHSRWREARDANKYSRMIEFGRALDKIRAAVERDLALPGLPRAKVLATVVRLLEVTHARVGNEEYARSNKSYGLTTLTSRHVDVDGTTITFSFRGKSGKSHVLDVKDPKVARIVRRCEELPGQRLFEYVGDDGVVRPVDSQDVNEYIRENSGGDFSAKDFRTLAGTVLAARALRQRRRVTSKAQLKRTVKRALEIVADRLGNTVAVCRRCYVHPAVIEAYERSALIDEESPDAKADPHGEERAVLKLIARCRLVTDDIVLPVSVRAPEVAA